MRSPKRTALVALVAALLAGFSTLSALGCGGGGSEAPEWALRLPDGAQFGAWSPDGELFAIPAHDRIELIETDGSVRRSIDVPGIDNSALACECRLDWTQDGSEIHVVTRPRPQARGGIATVEADGGNLRSRHLDLYVADAAWAPQGWPLLLTPGDPDYQGKERPPDRLPILRLGGLDAGLDVLLERGGEISGLSFSPDGDRFVFTEETGRGKALWIASRAGGEPRLLLRAHGNPYVSWSPDGRELALSAALKQSRQHRLFLVSATGGTARSLTEGPIAAEAPAWTPDGRWIAYADEESSVNKIRPDGSGKQRLFELPGEEIGGLSWSPDGRHLVFTAETIPPID
jgi:dipeptidyl aminopeptidase/acylaminoacyl peptidase